MTVESRFAVNAPLSGEILRPSLWLRAGRGRFEISTQSPLNWLLGAVKSSLAA